MSFARVALLSGLAAVALSACGSETTPPSGRGRIDQPRTAYSNHVACLRSHNLTVSNVTIDHLAGLQIGSAPNGPSVAFEPTPGAAQAVQIEGLVQSAEVIGSALLYPNGGSDSELSVVESCLAQGVTG